ncbi:MAG: mechanosensitive ion channel family protein [Dermatophilaceae bacterium]
MSGPAGLDPTHLPSFAGVSGAQFWDWFDGAPIRIFATVIGAVVLRWVLHRLIRRSIDMAISRGEREGRPRAERALAHVAGWSAQRHRQRLATLGTLLRSGVTALVGGIATLTIMSLAGIPLGPFLASAGVGGVALGFGAQSLVKDFLSGIFMIVEDQYGVGDDVDTGTIKGIVEDVSLRITSIRDRTGVLWHVRNGEILMLGNKSQGWGQALVEIPIAYDAPLPTALDVLAKVVDAFADDPKWSTKIVERPQVLGVERVEGASVTLSILLRCIPGEEFDAQRAMRRRAKVALDAAGIPGPRLLPGALGQPGATPPTGRPATGATP